MNKENLTNKEVSDALHCLFHCARENKKIYETQYQQFKLVYDYINQLETNIEDAIGYIKYCQTSDDDIFPVIEAEKMIEILKGGSNE